MTRIGYLAVGPDADPGWAYLTSLLDVVPRRLSLDAFTARDALELDGCDVVWVHATAEPPPLPGDRLRRWVGSGGRLLLTQRAAACVVGLGLEPDGPNDVITRPWRHAADELWYPEVHDHAGFPHVRGIAAFGRHPLFLGMGQGAYVWAPSEREPVTQATYARGRRPARGRVVGCERAYIHLNADRIVAWEYAVGSGGVLCVGAFVVLGAPDALLAPQLRALLVNALAGPAIPHAARAGPATVWPAPGRAAALDESLPVPPAPALDGALPGLESDLLFSTRALDDAPFSLAGRRALVLGGEQSGVREIWIHPHRVLQSLAVTVGGERPLIRDAQIAPAVVQRHLVSRTRIVEETVCTALEQPVALLEYRPEKIGRARGIRVPTELELEWTTELRRMWPYAGGAGGDLCWRVSPDRRAVVTTVASGATALFVASRPVTWEVRPREGGAAVSVVVRAALEEPLRLAVVGGCCREELDAALRACERRGVRGFTERRVRHEREVREGGVRLRSPDLALNTAFEWAKVRLDGFVVDTPGVGRSLAAGYAPARAGWGEGRPGYAWYFGRDACWTAFGMLAAGDFFTPRLVLRFLGDTQDATGKVIHEVTTSGLAHYDAADSTPLYLLLAGRYAAWTGDLAFLAAAWPRIERAYRFCVGTDRDGDGLVENTRVGHGWIEMGPLAGAHVTLYLAAVWVAALEALAPVARALGKTALAAELVARAHRARAAVEARFRTADGYALGILPDGTPQRNRTALTAVALALGAADPVVAGAWFDAVAGSDFSAPWGVRLVATTDPLYDPSGYHSGAVWPLYTGWAALAEYAHHRAAAGFAHVAANARLPFARQLGAFDEVLRGDAERGAGVCPDQAWSAAMLVLPVVEGMLGARPDALAGRLALEPHLPASWDACEWRRLHVGRTTLDVSVRAGQDWLRLGVARTAGPALAVTLAPALPAGRVVDDVRVDETPLAPRTTERLGCRHAAVTLDVVGTHEMSIRFAP